MRNMDFLEQLLDGQKVEWKKLGEVCGFQNGFAFRSSWFKEKGLPIIRITNISGGRVTDEDYKYFDASDYSQRVEEYKVEKGDILIAMSGATTGKIGWYDREECAYLNQRVGRFIPNTDILNGRFLYHYLQMQGESLYLMAGGGAQPNLSSRDIQEKFEIPLPSLSVQSRIVEILDKFTALEAELEEQLQAELELRKKQYAHYREQLLNFSSTPPHGFNVIWRKLGEVAEIGTGRSNREDEVTDGAYPFYVRSKNILRSSTYQFDETAIVIPGEGGIGDIYHYVVGKYALHQRAYRIKLKSEEKILPKFVYYYMTSAFKGYIISKSVGATATSIRRPMIEGFNIPIPPLSVQSRIVKILDKFDTLTNSITEGLPQEIKLRKQQYEYYREQLLNFPHH